MMNTIRETVIRSVACGALGLAVSLALVIAVPAIASTGGEAGVDHLPDLEAVSLGIFPPDPNTASEISLHAFVWNRSDVVVHGPIVVRLGIEGADGREHVIPELQPWQAVPVEAVLPPLEIGEYEAFVSVDPENRIEERLEANNRIVRRFHVGPPVHLPDLAVIQFQVEPREIRVGDQIFLEGMIWNGSEVAVLEPIEVRMGIDDRPAGEPIRIPGLMPGEARRVTAVFRPEEPGRHVAYIRVDPENEIRERREENNHRLFQFEVLPPPPVSVGMFPTGEHVIPPDGFVTFEALLVNHTDEFLTFPFRVGITRPGVGEPWIVMEEFEIELGPGEEWIEPMEIALPQEPRLLPGRYLLLGEAGDFDHDAFEFVVRRGGGMAE
jgi:hypothetical protein